MGDTSKEVTAWDGNDGMTMREWYAGMALQGILAACTGETNLIKSPTAARWAFDYADAMLAEAENDRRKAN